MLWALLYPTGLKKASREGLKEAEHLSQNPPEGKLDIDYKSDVTASLQRYLHLSAK